METALTSHPIHSLSLFSFFSPFYVIYSESHIILYHLDVVTVRLRYLEICWVRKWGKTKEGGGPQLLAMPGDYPPHPACIL
jgi:hypothetical protein